MEIDESTPEPREFGRTYATRFAEADDHPRTLAERAYHAARQQGFSHPLATDASLAALRAHLNRAWAGLGPPDDGDESPEPGESAEPVEPAAAAESAESAESAAPSGPEESTSEGADESTSTSP